VERAKEVWGFFGVVGLGGGGGGGGVLVFCVFFFLGSADGRGLSRTVVETV